MERRHYTIEALEVRAAAENATPVMEGYASVYDADSHDLGGFIERVSPSAFVRSLDAAKAGQTFIHALWGHDQNQPLGSTRGGKLALETDDHGLRFRLDTTRFNPAQLDAARDGDLQVSFGFSVRHDEWEFPEHGPAIRTLIDVELFEISPVVFPAYPDTQAAVRSMTEARSRFDAEAEIVIPDPANEVEEEDQSEYSEDFRALKLRLLKRWAEHKAGRTG